MGSISSINSTFLLSVGTVFPAPVLIQGYDVDDAFGSEQVKRSEIKKGVDGKFSYGKIQYTVKVDITLQADSLSIPLFEAWAAAEDAIGDNLPCNGILLQPALFLGYTLTTGVMEDFSPFSSAKKVQQPRKFAIIFNTVIGAPL